jgi:glycolate oxidase FAD binding subunit
VSAPSAAAAPPTGDLETRLAARGLTTRASDWSDAQREDLGAVAPARTCEPESLERLRDVVMEAGVSESPLLVVGGGTALFAGDPLARADLAVATRSLRGVVEHSPADFVITVEAGCRLAELQELLAPHRQWLAIEPPDRDAATIGGLVASGATSFVAAQHGTLRNHLLGVSVLHADGRFAKAGGRVVKNVAGYDLMKMHHGALGTLGVVATATLRLRPLPAHDVAAHAAADDPAAVVAVADALAQPGLLPAGAHFVGALRGAALVGTVVVRFQGARTACEEQVSQLETRLAGRVAKWRREEVAREKRPAPLRELDDVGARGAGTNVGHVSLHWPPSRLAEVVAALQRFGAGRIALDLARGSGFLKLSIGAGGPLADALALGLGELARALDAAGASAFLQAGPPAWRTVLPAHATQGPRARLAAALRAELDPRAILSRGRFA